MKFRSIGFAIAALSTTALAQTPPPAAETVPLAPKKTGTVEPPAPRPQRGY